MKLSDIAIQYGKSAITIADYIKHSKDVTKCKDLRLVGTIVYLKKAIDDIKIGKDYWCVDYIIEQSFFDATRINLLLIKVIQKLKIKEVPDYVATIFSSDCIDEKHDLFLKYLNELEF